MEMSIYNRHDYKTAIPQLEKQMNDRFDSLLNFFYPVGTVYETADEEFDPNKTWGGEWEQIEGKVLVGYDANDTDFATVGATGGAKGAWRHRHSANQFGFQYNRITVVDNYTMADIYQGAYTGYAGSTNNTLNEDIANMPPYEIVVIWKRIK